MLRTGGGGGADGGGDREGREAGGPVLGDGPFQRLHVQAEGGVAGDLAEPVLSDAENDARLLHGGVRLVRGVHAQARLPDQPAPAGVEPGHRFARRGQGHQGGGGGGVLDDAEQAGGQAEHLAQPVEGDQLELGGGGRGLPEHAVRVEGRREGLGQDGRSGGGVGEVGEEARVVPVGEAGDDHALDVGQDPGQRLGLHRRGPGQHGLHLAGTCPGQHGVAPGLLDVARDPVHQPVGLGAELVGGDVAETVHEGWAGPATRRPSR
jgi:hypothetical protein